ncbi:TetR/AcrR family transcriptional regulator [Phototrophicus methaneseepsis]|uniref:TetR/AcrR family transcriptional regulator n=1 Tax=Phototrophicus methaneseepsis TaxID=2710758 RepID=A0A7S8IFT4_9CHLR|nr:TetR/AcrR family transcriptional regulator [Phototrophicus methaneseepsis]QPC83941.1 TetR/AcrR family transcriptional regulator [Phototrophicus methaneseepsis]
MILLTTDKPVRADAARNRNLLLTTATRLFREEGVDAVTMSAIAQEAGVGKGTLYRHFSDKAELCHALLDEAMLGFQEETFAQLRRGGEAITHLRWFLRAAVYYVDQHIALLSEASIVGNGDMLGHPAHAWWRQTIIGLLRQIDVTGDIGYLADTLYIMTDVRIIKYQRDLQGYELDRIVTGLLNTLDAFLAR